MLFIFNLLSNKAVRFHIIHMQGQTLELLQNTSFHIICNETAVAYFKVLSTNLEGESEETLRNSECFNSQLSFKLGHLQNMTQKLCYLNSFARCDKSEGPKSRQCWWYRLINHHTSTITVMQNDGTCVLCVWIPVHVDIDDHWLDVWAEYSDAYCVGMSVILLAPQHDRRSQLLWPESYINRTNRANRENVGLPSTRREVQCCF